MRHKGDHHPRQGLFAGVFVAQVSAEMLEQKFILYILMINFDRN